MADETGEIIASFARGRPKLVETDKSMSAEEVSQLLRVCNERVNVDAKMHRRTSGKALRDYMIVVTALNVGLRASELCSLRVKDCMTSARPPLIVVRGGKARKARAGQGTDDIDEVHLDSTFAILLGSFIAKRNPDDLVFTSERENAEGKKAKLTPAGIWRIVKDLMSEAGLNEKYSVHTLRHRFVFAEIEAARAGGEVDPFFIARRARHRDIKMTMKYIHHDPVAMQNHLKRRKAEL